jgi:voltage-gated potassium channel
MATPEYRWRHLALLVSILLLFAVIPFAVTFRHGPLIMDIAATTILIAGTYALSERKHLFIIAIVLSVISVIAAALLLVYPQRWAVLLQHGCIVVLVTFFSVSILGYVLRSGSVTIDRIFAAVCVYMLIGFGWTFAYALLEEMVPGSFAPLPQSGPTDYVAHILGLRYFSFMTLTTVGYGDIIPRSAAARTMAVIEAVMGQIYLTVLVARLVGLHIVYTVGQRSHKD